MSKNQNKTVPTPNNINDFLNAIPDKQKRTDCFAILEIMKDITGYTPVLWGSIVGFGSYHYKYETGREGDSMITGFSPRSANITLYIMPGYLQIEHLLQKLGKHKTGKSCLYIKKLSDVDLEVLKEIITFGVKYVESNYPTKPS